MQEGHHKKFGGRQDSGHIHRVKGEDNKRKLVFPAGGGEYTNPEKMEASYAYVQSWRTEEEDEIPFLYWKVVDN